MYKGRYVQRKPYLLLRSLHGRIAYLYIVNRLVECANNDATIDHDMRMMANEAHQARVCGCAIVCLLFHSDDSQCAVEGGDDLDELVSLREGVKRS